MSHFINTDSDYVTDDNDEVLSNDGSRDMAMDTFSISERELSTLTTAIKPKRRVKTPVFQQSFSSFAESSSTPYHNSSCSLDNMTIGILMSKLDGVVSKKESFALVPAHQDDARQVLSKEDCDSLLFVLHKHVEKKNERHKVPAQHK